MCEVEQIFTNDFFKDLLSALIGTGSALLIFYLTLRKDKEKEQKQENQQNERRLNYLSNTLTATENQIESSIENLEESINDFDKDNLNFHLLRKNPNSSLDRLNEILRNENYFLAYLQEYGKENSEKYNNICLHVDFFVEQQKQVWEMTQKAQSFDYERKANFTKTVNDLMNRTAELSKSNILDKQYLDEINKIFKDFYDDIEDMSDLNYQYTKFIRPILETVLIKNINKPEVLKLISEFKNVSNLFNEIKLQNDTHNKSQKLILENYKDCLQLYKRDIKDLKNIREK